MPSKIFNVCSKPHRSIASNTVSVSLDPFQSKFFLTLFILSLISKWL